MTREEIDLTPKRTERRSSKSSIPSKPRCASTASGCGRMRYEELIRLCSKYTVARILERD